VKRLSQAGTPAILVRSETTIERPEKALAAISAWCGVAITLKGPRSMYR
jgi:hypothetical protein